MKKLLFILILIPLSNWAQEQTINGVVTDPNEPLPGVNIIEKGSANGVTTDFNGNYEIVVSSTDAILVFSYLGFKSQEITVGDQTTINMGLEEDVQQLEGVVVQGFGHCR